jgi:hypothetical protein
MIIKQLNKMKIAKTATLSIFAFISLCSLLSCTHQTSPRILSLNTKVIASPVETQTIQPKPSHTIEPSNTATEGISTVVARIKTTKTARAATRTAGATMTPPTLTFTPSMTFTPSITFTPRSTHTPTPTLDGTVIVEDNQSLSFYPLAVGDEKIYEITITYVMSVTEQDEMIYDEWRGLLHEKVVKQYATKEGIVVDLYYPDYPQVSTFDFGNGQITEHTESLIFRENTVYNKYGYIVFDFPFEIGKEWLAFDIDMPWYTWKVDTKQEISTPAGTFSDCYSLVLNTRPDTTQKWFCEGIGIVREYAWHHPAWWIYESVLVNFERK